MRPVEFIFSIVDKFAAMNEVEKAELRHDANLDYIKVKNDLSENEGIPKNLKQRVVKWSEYWVVRTLLAILFIYLLPQVQRYFDGTGNEEEENFDDFEIVD